MAEHDDGGPAFPRPLSHLSPEEYATEQDGMSLRDWLAGKSPLLNSVLTAKDEEGVRQLAALLGIDTPDLNDSESMLRFAIDSEVAWRWYFADAMLRHGQKEDP